MGTGSSRVAGIDVARALAALVMLQGHATDAWVSPEHQGGLFRASRFLGTFPLPAFLLLAGTSVAWRVAVGEERGESGQKIGRALRRRGVGLVAMGYAVSLAFAVLDGTSATAFVATVLRADVLHVIGLSITLAGALIPHRSHYAETLVRRCVALGILVTIASPLLPAFDVPLGMAALLGLFVDAAPVTRMPLVPLFAWFATGALCTSFMRGGSRTPFAQTAGANASRLVTLGGLALFATFGGYWLMNTLHAMGGVLNRQHVAIIGNVLDLAGRGALILVVGAGAAPFLPARLRTHLVLLGRGSLTVYIVHLPFCYGRFGAPLRDALTSVEAAFGIFVLSLGAYAFVRVWPFMRSKTRQHLASFFARRGDLR
ncbi:MAG: hypothetical protein ACI9KE_001907 [Polyangiales bacterium]